MIEEARSLANDPAFQAKVKSNDPNLWKPATEKLSTLPLNRSFRRDLSQMILLSKLRSKATTPTSGNRPPRNSHSSP